MVLHCSFHPPFSKNYSLWPFTIQFPPFFPKTNAIQCFVYIFFLHRRNSLFHDYIYYFIISKVPTVVLHCSFSPPFLQNYPRWSSTVVSSLLSQKATLDDPPLQFPPSLLTKLSSMAVHCSFNLSSYQTTLKGFPCSFSFPPHKTSLDVPSCIFPSPAFKTTVDGFSPQLSSSSTDKILDGAFLQFTLSPSPHKSAFSGLSLQFLQTNCFTLSCLQLYPEMFLSAWNTHLSVIFLPIAQKGKKTVISSTFYEHYLNSLTFCVICLWVDQCTNLFQQLGERCLLTYRSSRTISCSWWWGCCWSQTWVS